MRTALRPLVVGVAILGLAAFGTASAQADGDDNNALSHNSSTSSWYEGDHDTEAGNQDESIRVDYEDSLNTGLVFGDLEMN
ncbi:hypothetical protein ACWGJ2_18865 [Streptomyces sp. NPDC054796]